MRPEPDKVRQVAVVGAGTIGASWTAYFLAHGLAVRATDPDPGAEARLGAAIERMWPALAELGLAPGADRSRVTFHPTAARAVSDADFVQENGPEDEDTKIELFAEIDGSAPADAVIATSTSALLVTRLQSRCRRPERCVLAHPFNPPHLVPLVELGGGRHTEPAAVEWARAFYSSIGMRPVTLKREAYGHIVNRLQYVLWNEAVKLVLDGVATVEDIDAAIVNGPGLRWAFYGPFATYHLAGGEGGLARTFEIFQPRDKGHTDRAARVYLSPEERKFLVDGVLTATGGRSPRELAAERDRRLIALLKLRRALESGND